ncbi:MAG: hypothetical protein WBL05_00650, partial [Brooklawnia sp.]|uniref:hypothetical protein n=1 Tax=Brooklawnia sp. TaxID=2699740 RepID=UPI003C78FFD9
RQGRRRIAASLGLLVAIGSVSGGMIAGSSALSAAPATQTATAPAQTRETPISRDASRAELDSAATTPAASLPSVEPSAETAEPEVSEEPVQQAEVEHAEVAPAEPAFSVDTTTAPGQLTPASVDEAMAKAAEMTGNWGYQNMCLSLVAAFYGYSSAGEVGAQQSANTIIAAGQMHTDMSDIPVGALIWYDGNPVGNPYGHVAMYAGDGMVYSNGAPTGVGLIPLEEPAEGWGEPIIGWSSVWLPSATK